MLAGSWWSLGRSTRVVTHYEAVLEKSNDRLCYPPCLASLIYERFYPCCRHLRSVKSKFRPFHPTSPLTSSERRLGARLSETAEHIQGIHASLLK